jgi:hypothetical protein
LTSYANREKSFFLGHTVTNNIVIVN